MKNISLSVEHLFIGDEPSWANPKKVISVNRALSWYANQRSPKDSKNYLIEYARNIGLNKEIISKLSSAKEAAFNNSGFIARMISRGAKLEKQKWLENRIEQIVNYNVVSEFDGSTSTQIQSKPERNIKKDIFDIGTGYINELECVVDEIIKTKKTNFNIQTWFNLNDLKSVYLIQIKNFYSPLLQELTLALSKQDEQLNESYSSWKKKDLIFFKNFISDILFCCDEKKKVKVATKKSKAPKEISKEKTLSSLKYKLSDNDFKVVSIKPKEILGATQLWVFNTKYRTLGLYISEKGFSVKGTTIQGFDEALSVCKTLRKPLDTLPIVLQGKKTELKKLIPSIKAKEAKLNGRINNDIIILRAIK